MRIQRITTGSTGSAVGTWITVRMDTGRLHFFDQIKNRVCRICLSRKFFHFSDWNNYIYVTTCRVAYKNEADIQTSYLLQYLNQELKTITNEKYMRWFFPTKQWYFIKIISAGAMKRQSYCNFCTALWRALPHIGIMPWNIFISISCINQSVRYFEYKPSLKRI